MQALETQTSGSSGYRHILGVKFFAGAASEAVEAGAKGGLIVAPAAPALLELSRDPEYRQALLEADLAITDSGFLVLVWNLMSMDCVRRISGLEYLKLLLNRASFKERGSVIWVMPSTTSMERNLLWLKAKGYPFSADDCYVAPQYAKGPISDDKLVALINERQPKHVVICVGGGVQEKLGFYLKRRCTSQPAIHCIGAAIGFLTGDQVRIPAWADQTVLGWLFRCVSNPGRFVPRYARALELPLMLLRYGNRSPECRLQALDRVR